ncbi:MAG: deoxyribonuclease V [Anaerolineae bacterium]|nr:deoxyribonuclease V [Anaerolineae bacterium]
MKLAVSHRWDLPVKEAETLQTRLAAQVVARFKGKRNAIKTVAGVDVGFQGDVARAAAVVLSFPGLEPLDFSLGEAPITFPYRPGLLAFREGPAVLAALDKLATWPDLFLFDAQGIAHPRRLGLAAHLGVLLDCPSIGCAKSRLIGFHEEPGKAMGDWVYLYSGKGADKQVIGVVVRTKVSTKPLYVSVGHRIDLDGARDLVLRCIRGYRLPEPTRLAHNLASRVNTPIKPGKGQLPLF